MGPTITSEKAIGFIRLIIREVIFVFKLNTALDMLLCLSAVPDGTYVVCVCACVCVTMKRSPLPLGGVHAS